MKNASKFIFLLLIISLSLGCKKKTVHLNEEFKLDFNKTATVNVDGEKFEIKFSKLVEDSRCPPDAYCFWAGEAAIEIQLNKKTKSILGFHSKFPSEVVYKTHTIVLLEVNYNTKEHFSQEKYCSIRLKVK